MRNDDERVRECDEGKKRRRRTESELEEYNEKAFDTRGVIAYTVGVLHVKIGKVSGAWRIYRMGDPAGQWEMESLNIITQPNG